jgi:hypothetical protein
MAHEFDDEGRLATVFAADNVESVHEGNFTRMFVLLLAVRRATRWGNVCRVDTDLPAISSWKNSARGLRLGEL